MRRPFWSAGMPRPRRCTDVVKGTRSRKRSRRFQSRARDVPPRPYLSSDTVSAYGASRESSVRSHVQSICRCFADRTGYDTRQGQCHISSFLHARGRHQRRAVTLGHIGRNTPMLHMFTWSGQLCPGPCTGVRSWRVFASTRIVGRGVSFRQVSCRKKPSLGVLVGDVLAATGGSSFSRNADKNLFCLSADPEIYGLRFGGLRSELL